MKNKIKRYKIKRHFKRKRVTKKYLESFRGRDTNIEKKMEQILKSLKLIYTKQAIIDWNNSIRVFDFFVTKIIDGKIIHEAFIECDGDYWHPVIFNEDGTETNTSVTRLTKLQRKNVRNDRFKNKMAKKLGVKLLRFRGSDIMKSSITIKKKLKDFFG